MVFFTILAVQALIRDNIHIFSKFEKSPENCANFTVQAALDCKSLLSFDELFTRRVHCFDEQDLANFYEGRRVSDEILESIPVPMLMLHALDDDVVPKEDVPYHAIKHNHHLMLLTTDHGGHWYGNGVCD